MPALEHPSLLAAGSNNNSSQDTQPSNSNSQIFFYQQRNWQNPRPSLVEHLETMLYATRFSAGMTS